MCYKAKTLKKNSIVQTHRRTECNPFVPWRSKSQWPDIGTLHSAWS